MVIKGIEIKRIEIWKNEIASHLIVTGIYFLFISLMRLGELGRLGILGILELWLGGLLGSFFLDIDHLLYWFVTHPEKEDSREAKEIVRDFRVVGGILDKIKNLYLLLKKVHFTHTRLIFHSVVGQVVLFVLACYLLTSGGSIFGSAFILSINLHLLKDEWQDFFKDKKHLIDWLFWQMRAEITEKQLAIYLAGVTIVFLLLTGLV